MQRVERSNGFFRERLTGAFNNLRGNWQNIPTQSRSPKMSFTIRGSRFRDGAHGLSAMQDAITLNQRQIGHRHLPKSYALADRYPHREARPIWHWIRHIDSSGKGHKRIFKARLSGHCARHPEVPSHCTRAVHSKGQDMNLRASGFGPGSAHLCGRAQRDLSFRAAADLVESTQQRSRRGPLRRQLRPSARIEHRH